jgi:hypothetical protein
MLVSYLVGIGCSAILASICAFFWVRGIDNMKENHPNYNGNEFFGYKDEENDPDIDYRG